MPIRPEYRKYYRADWRWLRETMIERAGNVCEACRRPHKMLNLAHLSHDPADRWHLAVLCPSCHSKHDTKQRVAATRRTRAYQRGQAWLSKDLEMATVPARMLPFELRQLELFG